MELFRLWPESKRLTCSSFDNTTAIVNKVIYNVFKLVTHRLLPSANSGVVCWGLATGFKVSMFIIMNDSSCQHFLRICWMLAL